MLLLPAVSGSLNRLAFHAPLLLEPHAGHARVVRALALGAREEKSCIS